MCAHRFCKVVVSIWLTGSGRSLRRGAGDMPYFTCDIAYEIWHAGSGLTFLAGWRMLGCAQIWVDPAQSLAQMSLEGQCCRQAASRHQALNSRAHWTFDGYTPNAR